MASIPVTENYLQETDTEKKKQEQMMEELKTLTEKVGLTPHVKALMKETFINRKRIIDNSDSIKTVVSNFPFLLDTEMALSPPGDELVTKETEGPRLVTYVENNVITAAFVVADGKRIKINKPSTTES
ncbi:PREDICTED: uncharacterized protein LOC105556826 isoform X2 [Vollenhovia emeryi]|uniref:uncharacterized protein LOC105556826 isoform X2 n=1 Tax=Vollenhovia emeryi TaxID=411798 RepID=UPI0005F49BBD|nr:PREDICTED: uncharacterized protein LOC105556826 isoform X2 [Vollenhovia emeryi]